MNIVTRLLLLLFFVLGGLSCSGSGQGDGDSENSETGDAGGIVDASGAGTHKLLAFNDLGMHCADLDYSTFVILPPFNVVHSQVIERGAEPRIVDDSQVTVRYRAVTDASGSITTTSQDQPGAVHKSNFWDINPDTGNTYVFDLFGLDPAADEGLTPNAVTGQTMPGISNPYMSNNDQPFNEFNPDKDWFAADGIPILPVDDAGQSNAYPLMRVSAISSDTNEIVARTDVVLPVASEADCQNCHALGEVGTADNNPAYVFADNPNDPNSVLQAAKHNILVLHDARHSTDLLNQKPVLCARCHYSAALDLSGTGPAGEQLGKPKMSAVMHGHHGELKDSNGNLLFPANGTLEQTCYQCHPGKVTKCLRGAMGGAGIECVDCHGSMLAVGSNKRQPWLDEPMCESCHTGDAVNHLGSDIRLGQAWDGDINTATPRVASNKRFAENNGTLYRNSLGHGGVACEGCHGSTHAIWPNALPSSNDNIAANQLQGHAGTITECSTCHTSLRLTLNGPHGMHNVNSREWNLEHEDFYERNADACRACHGQNLEGTVLSETAADRDFLRDDDGNRTIHVAKGTQVSCDMCHHKPR